MTLTSEGDHWPMRRDMKNFSRRDANNPACMEAGHTCVANLQLVKGADQKRQQEEASLVFIGARKPTQIDVLRRTSESE